MRVEGWRPTRLGEFAWEVSDRPSTNGEEVLSVTKHAGFVPSLEYFGKQVFSKDTANYKLVSRGQFAYATIHLDEGSIDCLRIRDHGLISPMYTVFDVDPGRVDRRFLLELLQSPEMLQRYSAIGSGSVNRRRSIGFDVLAAEVLHLPPLAEQKKIAAILSSVDEAIQATQAVIEQTRRVKEGLLQDLLTRGIGHTRFKQTEIGEIPESWRVARLGTLCELVTSGPRGWAEFYAQDGSPFIRSQNIRNGYLDWSERAFVRPPEGAETERARLSTGDILVTITGNNVGNVAQLDVGVDVDAFASQHVGVIRLVDRSTSTFYSAFMSPDGPGQRQLMRASYGQSKPGLGLAQLRNLLVPVVPNDERKRIDAAMHSVSDDVAALMSELAALVEVKAGLLQDLLTGKVRVSV